MRSLIRLNSQNGLLAASWLTTIFRLLRMRARLGSKPRSNRSCSACMKIPAACFSVSMCGVSSAAGRSMARQSRKNDWNRTAFKAAVSLSPGEIEYAVIRTLHVRRCLFSSRRFLNFMFGVVVIVDRPKAQNAFAFRAEFIEKEIVLPDSGERQHGRVQEIVLSPGHIIMRGALG
jgi:hypothetical protein